MINNLKNNPQLKDFIADNCEENNVSVQMESGILPDNYVIIKVDRFYNSLHLANTPASVDCLVLLKCSDEKCVIYLVELKNIKSPKRFEISNIYDKFKTTIEDFMNSRFKEFFNNPELKVKDIKLYFVTDPYGQLRGSHKRENTKMDWLLRTKPFSFRDKKFQLQHKLPNPAIRAC